MYICINMHVSVATARVLCVWVYVHIYASIYIYLYLICAWVYLSLCTYDVQNDWKARTNFIRGRHSACESLNFLSNLSWTAVKHNYPMLKWCQWGKQKCGFSSSVSKPCRIMDVFPEVQSPDWRGSHVRPCSSALSIKAVHRYGRLQRELHKKNHLGYK